MGLIAVQGLEPVWMRQYVTPLLRQGGQLTGELILLGNADLKHLPGFRSCGDATQGGQAQSDPMGILELAYAVLFGQPEQRLDGIGADGQAARGEAKRRGGLELALEVAGKIAAHGGRGDGVAQRIALRQRVVTQALSFENLLAFQKGEGSCSKPLDQRFASGQLIKTGSQL